MCIDSQEKGNHGVAINSTAAVDNAERGKNGWRARDKKWAPAAWPLFATGARGKK